MKAMLRYLILVLGLSSAVVFAQDTASITGTVTDASGAAVTKAQVTLTNVQQGLTRSATTNDSGEYLFAALPVGTYTMNVSATGFKRYEAKGIGLAVGQKARSDIHLQVGAAQEQVNVEGTSVAQVETQASELTGVVTGKEITEL